MDGDGWRCMEMGGDHGAPPFRQDEKEISQEIRVVDNRVKNRLGILTCPEKDEEIILSLTTDVRTNLQTSGL